MRGLTALLAVRDAVLRSQLEHALARAGFEVSAAGSADVALALGRERALALAVVEEALDGGAGAALIAALRASPGAAAAHVIALVEPGASSVSAVGDAEVDVAAKPLQLDLFHRRLRGVARALRHASALEARCDALAEEARALGDAHLAAGLGLWECDAATGEIALTHAAQQVFAVDARLGSLDALISRAVHPDEREKVLGMLREAAPGAAIQHRVSGAHRFLRHVVVRAHASRASDLPLCLLAQDVTAQCVAEDRLRRIALYDPVTELPGRSVFLARLERALERFAGSEPRVAVLSIDLGIPAGFVGSSAHDELLRRAAQRVVLSVRPHDTVGRLAGPSAQPGVARLGGEHFAVALTGIEREPDADACARRIGDALAAPISLPGHARPVLLEPRVRVTLANREGASAESLVAAAARPRGSAARERAPDPRESRAATIVADLPLVAERGELSLLFQPRIALAEECVSGAEALVRWRHPKLGEIPPKDFIGIAERDGVIDAIGSWVLASATRAAAGWASGRVSVNVSRSQLQSGGFARAVFRALIDANLRPERLELEVTESLMYESEDCLEALRELAAVGVTLALDDFGTGYSSLSALVRFPVHVIKVDRSIVRDIDENPDALRVVRGVVRVGHDLGMRVVAEGIDRASQVPLLVEAGCDEAQGFLFARPLPAEEYADFAARWRPGSLRTLDARGPSPQETTSES